MDRHPAIVKLAQNFVKDRIVWDEYMTLHHHKCMTEFGYASIIIDETLTVLPCLIQGLNYLPRHDWPKHRSTQYLFLPNICETLYCAKKTLFDGFYDESVILSRSAFDGLMRIVFISCYQTASEAVLVEKAPDGMIRFNMTNFLRDTLKLPEWVNIWQLQSVFTHGKRFRVLKYLADARKTGETPAVSLNLRYDEKGFGFALNQINFLCYYILRLTKVLFPYLETAPRLTDSIKERYLTVQDAYSAVLDDMVPRLRQTKTDFDKIERIILAAESGQDWIKLT